MMIPSSLRIPQIINLLRLLAIVLSIATLSACSTDKAHLQNSDSYCEIYQIIKYPTDILKTDNQDHRQKICELFKDIDQENCVFIATCDPVLYITPDETGQSIKDYCKTKKTC